MDEREAFECECDSALVGMRPEVRLAYSAGVMEPQNCLRGLGECITPKLKFVELRKAVKVCDLTDMSPVDEHRQFLDRHGWLKNKRAGGHAQRVGPSLQRGSKGNKTIVVFSTCIVRF